MIRILSRGTPAAHARDAWIYWSVCGWLRYVTLPLLITSCELRTGGLDTGEAVGRRVTVTGLRIAYRVGTGILDGSVLNDGFTYLVVRVGVTELDGRGVVYTNGFGVSRAGMIITSGVGLSGILLVRSV